MKNLVYILAIHGILDMQLSCILVMKICMGETNITRRKKFSVAISVET